MSSNLLKLTPRSQLVNEGLFLQTNTTGSAGDTFLDLKGTPSKSASRLGQSSFEKSHGSVNVKDRQLQKCYQELEVGVSKALNKNIL